MRQVLTHIRGGQNRKLLDDGCSHRVSREDAAVSSEGDGSVRARPLVARETFFISFALASVRPSVCRVRHPLARSLGGIQNFCLSLTRLLTRPMRVPPRARAPAPHGPTSPSLPPCRPPSISVISKSAVLAARRARARSGDAVWKVISVLGPLSLPPSLPLSFSFLP